MKRIKSLLKIAGMKFEFKNLKIHIDKRQISFQVVKYVKGKRGFSKIPVALLRTFLNCEMTINIARGRKLRYSLRLSLVLRFGVLACC